VQTVHGVPRFVREASQQAVSDKRGWLAETVR
jgi:hypothetical protein